MPDFKESIISLSKRVEKIKGSISTEEATKTSIIMPFFQLLGYDVFNPEEFTPEYIADVGIKKGEKVDYAIMDEGKPVILIEAKSINEKLVKHDSQLFRYFGTSAAKFSILTNGIIYKFYTDLDEQNKMDSSPFFEFNLLDPKDNNLNELSKFRKDRFDLDNIFSTASELKYTNKIKTFLNGLWEEPSEEFITFILNNIYDGRKTKNVMDQFTPIIKKSMKQFLNELVSEKLNAALKSTSVENDSEEQDENLKDDEGHKEEGIITTEEEIQGFTIARLILSELVNEERVFYRDNKSYFNILLDDSIRKWVCRLGLDNSKKYIQFNDSERTTYSIEKVSDIMNYRNKFIEVAKTFDLITN
ncbi:type I restriction endonuclease [Radiobacillus deserti]|uniref:Endonuclease n=1 Tax=Radiobacillus deserti TaxID=2594883 RepID=A0A516KET4_9BACI|nr:type I restriction endonuclease [Radiobacillus deserti]QDP39913.1 endonuclease [Radiobacillus deserti]